jgi:protein-L-isoaspartate O-methyltransferase
VTSRPIAEELRLALVRKLRRDGTLRAGRIERAFGRVPRHMFLREVDLDYVVGAHGQVTAIDLDADTVRRARGALSSTGYSRVRVERTDGMAGFDECAPYERIVVTVGMGDIPLACGAS